MCIWGKNKGLLLTIIIVVWERQLSFESNRDMLHCVRGEGVEVSTHT